MYSEKSSIQNKRLFWSEQVTDWIASGLSKKQFCLQRGLVCSTFGYWSRKLAAALKNSSACAQTDETVLSDSSVLIDPSDPEPSCIEKPAKFKLINHNYCSLILIEETTP